MGRKRTVDPLKMCQACGAVMHRKKFGKAQQLEDNACFARRKYCSIACRGAGCKVQNPSRQTLQRRLWEDKALRKPACERCGGIERLSLHHKDRNPFNNEQSNHETLCVRCHTKEHWRTDDLKVKHAAPCQFCEMPSRRHGMCEMHWQRFRKYGDALLTKVPRKGTRYEFDLVRVEPQDGLRR